jgi:hypothetical protein
MSEFYSKMLVPTAYDNFKTKQMVLLKEKIPNVYERTHKIKLMWHKKCDISGKILYDSKIEKDKLADAYVNFITVRYNEYSKEIL